MRVLPAIPLLLCMASVAAGEEPVRVALEGAPATVTAPAGGFEQAVQSPGPGQWQIRFTRDDGVRLEARVFPVQAATNPSVVLFQAVAKLAELLGYPGFGVPSHQSVDLFGHPGADGAIQMAVDGKPRAGRCRLLRAGEHTWAFAWGLEGADSTLADRALIGRFVESLEPDRPAFWFERFRDEAALAQPVSVYGSEPVVTAEDALAAALAIEIAVGMRLPLEVRGRLVKGIGMQIQRWPGTASIYLDAARAVHEAVALPRDERHGSMAEAGRALIARLREHGEQGDMASAVLIVLLDRAGKPAFEGGPPAAAVASRVELAAFLASVADDRPVAAAADASATVEQAFVALEAEDRAALARAGATWAVFRRAWDAADAAARRRFRLAVRAALGDEPLPAEIEARALYRCMHDQRSDERSARIFARALALSGGGVAELLALLGVPDDGYRPGW